MLPSWRIVLTSACIAFIALEWILPFLIGRIAPLQAIVPLIRSLAWLVLIVGSAISFVLHAWHQGDKNSGSLPENTPPLDAGEAPTTMFKSVDQWTLQALRELEWKRFEQLCAKYYEALGFDCKAAAPGPDGGIALYRGDHGKPIAVVQCKAWNSAVGEQEIRALLGAMTHVKVERGIFITTGAYTREALAFGTANPLQLIDGRGFLERLEQLPKETLAALLQFAFDGDYATPTCASCGIKMIGRESRRGQFWGCRNFPACRNTLARKS